MSTLYATRSRNDKYFHKVEGKTACPNHRPFGTDTAYSLTEQPPSRFMPCSHCLPELREDLARKWKANPAPDAARSYNRDAKTAQYAADTSRRNPGRVK